VALAVPAPTRFHARRLFIEQQVGRGLAQAEGPQKRSQEEPEHGVLRRQYGAVHHGGHKQGQEEDQDGRKHCNNQGKGGGRESGR
jgi:hypothetical protein